MSGRGDGTGLLEQAQSVEYAPHSDDLSFREVLDDDHLHRNVPPHRSDTQHLTLLRPAEPDKIRHLVAFGELIFERLAEVRSALRNIATSYLSSSPSRPAFPDGSHAPT
jgi:hypothetical protein